MSGRQKIRWGVLGVAKIAVEKVIPGMQRGRWSAVTAIASRDEAKARGAAAKLGLAKAYGSYDELLDDPDIDAIYNPLPNHLHMLWTTCAAERGKHVLCEKPIALNASQARQLIQVRDRTRVLIQEAFMVRAHPQWIRARSIVRDGQLGDVRAILGAFSYYNDNPKNIRNIPEFGGGALMDIGCYLVNTSRYLFEREPQRVMGLVERDPALKTDRLTSMILDYGAAHAVGTCSTQMVPYQRIQVLGTRGRIEIEIPFNAPPDRACRLSVDTGDLLGAGMERIDVNACDQYTLQGDLFSKAILDGSEAPVPLEDSVSNMACIDAILRSAETGQWERP